MASQPRPARAERRELFLDVTAGLVETEGVAAVTMERVAAMAGLSKPVIYSHFGSRGELLLALLERSWRNVDTAVQARLSTAKTLDDNIDALVVGYFDAVADQGALMTLMSNTSQEPLVESARQARIRAAEAEWSAVYRRRAGLPAAVADACAAILRSTLQGATEYWIDHPDTSRELVSQTCSEIMRAGLARLRRQARLEAAETAAETTTA